MVAFLKPEWIGKTWVWLIGLGGSAAVILKKFFHSISGKTSLSDIDSSNEEIKQKLQALEVKINETNARMQLERELYKKYIELLEHKIALKEKEILLQEEKRKKLEQMPWEEYINSLTVEQKRELQSKMDANTSSFIN